jgi:hypothetical protein
MALRTNASPELASLLTQAASSTSSLYSGRDERARGSWRANIYSRIQLLNGVNVDYCSATMRATEGTRFISTRNR